MTTPQKNFPRPTGPAGQSPGGSTGPAGSGTSSSTVPEAVRLAVLMWAVAVGLELVHQILSIVMGFVDPADLLAAAREAGAEEQLPGDSDAAVQLAAYSGIIVMGLINLVIVAVLAVALRLFATKHKMAGGSRRLLMIFSLFLAFRGSLVFAAQPAGTDIPQLLYLVDGSIQIVVAVTAVLGLIFSQRQETLEFTGEAEQARELAKKTDDDTTNPRK